jgi:hypothetical protein
MKNIQMTIMRAFILMMELKRTADGIAVMTKTTYINTKWTALLDCFKIFLTLQRYLRPGSWTQSSSSGDQFILTTKRRESFQIT